MLLQASYVEAFELYCFDFVCLKKIRIRQKRYYKNFILHVDYEENKCFSFFVVAMFCMFEN